MRTLTRPQDIFEFISDCAGEQRGIDEASALLVVTRVISALEHVHMLGYAHRGRSRNATTLPANTSTDR